MATPASASIPQLPGDMRRIFHRYDPRVAPQPGGQRITMERRAILEVLFENNRPRSLHEIAELRKALCD